MRRKRLAAGEIRFRVSKDDLKRIDWLLQHTDHQTVSSMIRTLIKNHYEVERLIVDGSKEETR
jgi:hypothetical protein